MCGRYTLTVSAQRLEAELSLVDVPSFLPRYNQAPTQLAPIITSQTPDRITMARWGLLPDWARDSRVASDFVNARSEKARTHATYSSLIRSQRCLVPASGFIEWRRDGALRRPHLLAPKTDELLMMAGIWNRWRSPDGVHVDTFTMFTVPASDEVSVLHDRMPAFLQTTDARAVWLSSTKDLDAVAKLLAPWSGLVIREINSRVNNVQHDDAACLSAPATTQLPLF